MCVCVLVLLLNCSKYRPVLTPLNVSLCSWQVGRNKVNDVKSLDLTSNSYMSVDYNNNNSLGLDLCFPHECQFGSVVSDWELQSFICMRTSGKTALVPWQNGKAVVEMLQSFINSFPVPLVGQQPNSPHPVSHIYTSAPTDTSPFIDTPDDVDARGLHGLTCRRSSARQQRHSQVNDIIWRAINKAQVPSTKEPVGLTIRGNRRMGGVTLLQWSWGNPWHGM